MRKIRQQLILIAILAFMTGCGIENNEKNTLITNNDIEVLRHLKEVDWPGAYAEQDTVLLDSILGDDFNMIDQEGNWYTKNDELNWIKNNAPGYDSFYFEITRLDIFDNGTAIICGTGHILKDSLRSVYQSSNVLVKREGRWKAVLSHVSGVKNIEE
jgi:hypothetical protein